MEKKRAFVAIDVSESAKDAVMKHISQLREHQPDGRARWLSRGNLHVTMLFVGEVDAAGLRELDENVHRVAAMHDAFEAKLEATGNFARRRIRQDELWIGIHSGNSELETIANDLMDASSRKFVPHLTIARIKDATHAKPLVDEHLATEFPAISFIVGELVIYESTLAPTGSVYSVLSRHRLKSD